MARKRLTVDRSTVVTTANRMIAHLSESGTKSDSDKREAIIAVTSQILLDANAYCGFRSLNPPQVVNGEKVWDNTRIAFYG